MYCEDDHHDSRENVGCCCALIYKLRENRRVLVVSLLLIATMTAIAKGMYDGITMKEYSTATIALGIFFPSIIIVIICIYIVIDYTQHSSSRISPRVHYSPNQSYSHSCEDIAHHPDRCLGNRINVKVEQRLSMSGSPIASPSITRTVEIRRKEYRSSTESPPVSCKSQKRPKVSRSCSDPDIFRHNHPSNEMAHGGRSCKKHENGEMALRGNSCKKHENFEYSPRCTEGHRVLKPITRLEKCLSDTSGKYKELDSEEKVAECNYKLAGNFRRYEGKEPSLKGRQHSDRKLKENVKNILSANNFYPPKNLGGNFKSSKDNATECDCMMKGNEIRRDRKSCMHVDGYSFQNVRENVDSPKVKHGMSHLSKTCEGTRARGEHKEPLRLSPSAQAQADNLTSSKSEMNVLSTEETQYQYKQSNLRSEFLENGKGQKCITSLQNTETRDRVKRKTIYFPTPSFNFFKYPGHARQEHSCHPRNDKLAMRLSPSKKENTDCHSVSEPPKEKGYRPFGNTPRLSPHTIENRDQYCVSDTREKKSPTICYVEKRLTAINKEKSDCRSMKELKKVERPPFCTSSIGLLSISDENRTRRSMSGSREKKIAKYS